MLGQVDGLAWLLVDQREPGQQLKRSGHDLLVAGGLAELVGLRRRHVDLAGGRLHVVEQAAEVAGKFITGPPKTDAAGGS